MRHLRDRRRSDPADSRLPERIDVYARLLYQKFEDALSACFPVTRELLGEPAWSSLVRDFIALHRCASPYYRQIPDEFVTYLRDGRFEEDDPPFLGELAHYEWLELVLAIAIDEPIDVPIDRTGNLLSNHPVLAPVLHVHGYRWPVHTMAPTQPHWERWRDGPQSALPIDESGYFILAFRDFADQVHLIEINALTARLIGLLQSGDTTGKEALLDLAAEARYLDLASFIPFGEQTLKQLRDWGAILGTRQP